MTIQEIKDKIIKIELELLRLQDQKDTLVYELKVREDNADAYILARDFILDNNFNQIPVGEFYDKYIEAMTQNNSYPMTKIQFGRVAKILGYDTIQKRSVETGKSIKFYIKKV